MVAHRKPARADTLPLSNSVAADRLDLAADRLESRGREPVSGESVPGGGRDGATADPTGGRHPAGRRAAGIMELPAIGPRLAVTLEGLLLTGHIPQVEALGDRPEDLFATLSGVGPETARRIADALHVETLEELERAAYDGRLAAVPGMGPKRLRGIREALAGRFRRPVGGPPASPPPVADILEVDAAYRDRAGRGLLRRIAPRRFNPSGEAWLPVFKTRKHGYRYRAMFSNTAAAHRLAKEHDWVVVYFEQAGATGQCTVVTETGGPLAGRRVVRGREAESARHYGIGPGQPSLFGPSGA